MKQRGIDDPYNVADLRIMLRNVENSGHCFFGEMSTIPGHSCIYWDTGDIIFEFDTNEMSDTALSALGVDCLSDEQLRQIVITVKG